MHNEFKGRDGGTLHLHEVLPCFVGLQERERVAGEEARKTAEQNAKYQAQLAQYEDELSRKRLEQEHELNRQRNAELVKMQEDSARAKEEQRRVIEEQIQVSSSLPVHGKVLVRILLDRNWSGWDFEDTNPSCTSLTLSILPVVLSLSNAYLCASGREPSGQHRSLLLCDTNCSVTSHFNGLSYIQAERRATEKYKSDLQKDIEREKALAEAEGGPSSLDLAAQLWSCFLSCPPQCGLFMTSGALALLTLQAKPRRGG